MSSALPADGVSAERGPGATQVAGLRAAPGAAGLPGAWALAVIEAYQRFVSPLLPRACRFHPTCSAYCAEAIRRYGLARGLWRGASRLLRCQPFSQGGYDPVR